MARLWVQLTSPQWVLLRPVGPVPPYTPYCESCKVVSGRKSVTPIWSWRVRGATYTLSSPQGKGLCILAQ